jgi:hypothetical protein
VQQQRQQEEQKQQQQQRAQLEKEEAERQKVQDLSKKKRASVEFRQTSGWLMEQTRQKRQRSNDPNKEEDDDRVLLYNEQPESYDVTPANADDAKKGGLGEGSSAQEHTTACEGDGVRQAQWPTNTEADVGTDICTDPGTDLGADLGANLGADLGADLGRSAGEASTGNQIDLSNAQTDAVDPDLEDAIAKNKAKLDVMSLLMNRYK